jgi:hypothetical protein
MSRKSPIRWRESDLERVSKEVKRFNDKITRTLKKHPELAGVLPEKINKKKFIEGIETRQDFNREIKSIGRFAQRGAEKVVSNKKGLKVTAWEKKEIGYKVGAINRERAKVREKNNVDVNAKGLMGKMKDADYKPKKINFKNKSKKDWEKFVQSVEEQVRANYKNDSAESYKNTYLEMIKEWLGESGKDLYKIINQIPSDLVYENYLEDYITTISFTSDDLLPQEDRVETAIEKWKDLLWDKYNIDFDKDNMIIMPEDE